MNPCNVQPFLTAYLLGDLEPKKAAAIRKHLASCPACSQQVERIRSTLSLLKEAYPAEHAESGEGLVLDPVRRQQLLTVKPAPQSNTFLRFVDKTYRPLRRIAATLICVFGILVILAAALFPAGGSAIKKANLAARAAREKDISFMTVTDEDDRVEEISRSKPEKAAYAELADQKSSRVDGDSVINGMRGGQSKAKQRERDNVVAMDAPQSAKSPVILKNIQAATSGVTEADMRPRRKIVSGHAIIDEKRGRTSELKHAVENAPLSDLMKADADVTADGYSTPFTEIAKDASKVGADRRRDANVVMKRSEEQEEAADRSKKQAPPHEPLPFNPFIAAAAEPFSTFAMDVDTASYTLTRQALRSGRLPDPERVRLEEVVNAFDYGDTAPDHTTFRIYQDGAQSPFGAGCNLLRIGVKGRRLGREEQRPAMLTFLIDVSGSMSQPDRIGFARLSLSSLLDQMGASDRIQIIAYSDQARIVMEATPATEKTRLMAAFDRLQCNGSTNLEEGLRRAYEQAVKTFIPGAENRVILISDGVANLGADSAQEILDKIAANRKQGITCSVFGVGAGTYNDKMLEELANKGDGVYRFLDSTDAIKTAFVDDLAATLNTIAKDAKIQVEWNPKTVKRYRQMGYENRKLTKEQFRDDTVDAGEVGSGQSVTALYELELMPDVTPEAPLGTVRIRYQRTDNGKVEEIEKALVASTVLRPVHKASVHFKVAASAAEFAELLRGSPHAQGGSFDAVADYLRPAVLECTLDTRIKELLELVTTAASLTK